MAHAPEQGHNHNLDGVTLNYPCPISRLKAKGPEKATRGGGEWEPIKITHSNVAYIPNSKIRHTLSPVFSPGKIRRVLSLGKIGQSGQAKTDKFSALVKSDW
jgi:hypothetical protein